MKTIFLLSVILAATGLMSHAAEMADNDTSIQELSVGIVPQQAASKLARLWTPVLKYLSDKSGYQLRFKTAPNIPTFEERVHAGEYDLAYMNPYHYTVFHIDPGYQAFAKEKDKKIQGLVVVRKDSTVNSLTELGGQTLAFPAPAAFAASVLPRAYLAQHNILITPKYVSSHDSVYRSVAKGLYPAGGGIQRTFDNVEPAIRDQLRILWETQKYTPHALAAHPRVPSQVVEQIQLAMLEMSSDPAGMELLSALNFRSIESAADEDWDDVRALGIDLLQKLINEN